MTPIAGQRIYLQINELKSKNQLNDIVVLMFGANSAFTKDNWNVN